MSLREKALSPSTWPIGLVFREFIDRRQSPQYFWRPTGKSQQPYQRSAEMHDQTQQQTVAQTDTVASSHTAPINSICDRVTIQ